MKIMDLKCQVCGCARGLKRCARCKRVAYCGRDHQIQDWKEHKLQCHQNANIINTPGGTGTVQVQAESDSDHSLTWANADEDESTKPINFQSDRKQKSQTIHTKICHDNEKKISSPFTNVSGSSTSKSASPITMIHQADRSINDGTPDAGTTQKDFKLKEQSTFYQTPSPHREEETSAKFDKRPYKNIKFPKPKSLSTKDISKHVAAHLENHGFCVVDNIMCEKKIEKVHQEVENIEMVGQLQSGKLAGGKTSDENSEKVVNANIRSDIITWLEGNEPEWPAITHLVSVMDDIVTGLNSHLDGEIFLSGRTKAMVACYPADGTNYMRHVDNPNKDGRRVTCICYLNKNWNVQQHGGLLRIFPGNLGDDYIDVAPLMNRMLFFWSDNRMPHEVQPAFSKRYAITIWYFDDAERKEAKTAQINAEVAKVKGEVALLDIKKKEIEMATLQKHIEIEAEKAVAALSEGELKALADLVKGHPDPASLLTSMGINTNIQKSLFIVLKSRFGVNL